MSRKKLGEGTYELSSPVIIRSSAAVVGRKEKEGPLGAHFEHYQNDE